MEDWGRLIERDGNRAGGSAQRRKGKGEERRIRRRKEGPECRRQYASIGGESTRTGESLSRGEILGPREEEAGRGRVTATRIGERVIASRGKWSGGRWEGSLAA